MNPSLNEFKILKFNSFIDKCPLCFRVSWICIYVILSCNCNYFIKKYFQNRIDKDLIRVRLGEHDMMNNNENPPHKIYDIETVKIHPNFNNTNLANDLALIRVGEQILYE